jgi:hypothetical protein
MLAATEQQLKLVENRCTKLEATVKAQVDDLRRLTDERDTVVAEAELLRRRLQELEAKAASLGEQHGQAMLSLRSSALEFSKTQLLSKKYRNTVAELRGQCKAFVVVDNCPDVKLSDGCTIDAANRASFTFDAVTSLDSVSDESFGVPQLIRDVLTGYNTCAFTFGPARVGKTKVMFGTSGLVRGYITSLFDSLADHEVTHFNMRCSLGELHMDQFIDHLAEYGHTLAIGGSSEIRSIAVQSAEEALRLVEVGTQRLDALRRPRGHVFFAMTVENFDRRGHFRKGSALFVDIAGAHPQGSAAGRTPESQWVLRSVSSLCNAISLFAAAGPEARASAAAPQSSLLRLFKEAIGGNCKTSLIAVGASSASSEELFSTLTYASHFKTIENHPTPYDIPAELQKLNLEASTD